MTLFINNLLPQVNQADLLELLAEYGTVKHIFFPTDWKTNQSLGFAFIAMSVKAQEEVAMSELNGAQWMGNQLQIREISSQEHIYNKQGKDLKQI